MIDGLVFKRGEYIPINDFDGYVFNDCFCFIYDNMIVHNLFVECNFCIVLLSAEHSVIFFLIIAHILKIFM